MYHDWTWGKIHLPVPQRRRIFPNISFFLFYPYWKNILKKSRNNSLGLNFYLLIIFKRTVGISKSVKDTFPFSECVSRKGTNRNMTSYCVTDTSSGFETETNVMVFSVDQSTLKINDLLTGRFFAAGDKWRMILFFQMVDFKYFVIPFEKCIWFSLWMCQCMGFVFIKPRTIIWKGK